MCLQEHKKYLATTSLHLGTQAHAAVWTDVVSRGDMVISPSGGGKLPLQVRPLSPPSAGPGSCD